MTCPKYLHYHFEKDIGCGTFADSIPCTSFHGGTSEGTGSPWPLEQNRVNILEFTSVVIKILGFNLYLFIGVSRLGFGWPFPDL